ncbi:competence/damage-inducible protein A [soil metagenome]
MNKAHIITIGSELLIGDTVNTNASWIGRFMNAEGFDVEKVITLPDRYELLKKQIANSLKEADFTIVTGGLGPTHDDITKKVVADLFGSELVTDQNVLQHIKDIFRKRHFVFSQSNADQALVPNNSTVLFNKKGTAPGLWFHEKDHVLAVLPGVPHEMKYLIENEITPRLESAFPDRSVKLVQYFHTAGVPESTLSDEVIGDLTEYLNNGLEVAYLPNAGGVKIRVSYSGEDSESAGVQMLKFRKMILKRASDVIYGEGKECDLASVAGELLDKQNKTIAVAESCTGGRLSDAITNIPGCSQYMLGGIIAYSNELKMQHLNVTQQDLQKYGAVSRQVALQMAKGVAEQTGSDIGVSTTGVAGPGGGTKEKPVGTVWMGFWISGDHFALKAVLADDREINKQRTTMVVLETVRRHLSGITHYPYNITPIYP